MESSKRVALSKIEWRIQFVYFFIYYVVICREDVAEIYLYKSLNDKI